MTQKTAVLLLGFGGPEKKTEVVPFLQKIFGDKPVPPSAFQAVVGQYERIGGKSPYVPIAKRQKKSLEIFLRKNKKSLPVFLGFLYSKPFLADSLKKISRQGFKKIIAVVLTSFRSEPSFGRYQNALSNVVHKLKGNGIGIQVRYTDPLFGDSSFAKAHQERVTEALRKIPKMDWPHTYFIFTAHSIPERLSKQSAYAAQCLGASKLVAKRLGLKSWGIAYQSRSVRGGSEAWLGPSIEEALNALPKDWFKNVFFIPIGFLINHKEVLYDLDIQARREAENLGFRYYRAETLMDHPAFIQLLGKRILRTL